MDFLSNLPGIILALIAFGVLILVHEVGHLVAAKRSGVLVEEFWIGMGPTLLSHQFGETKYCLRLLPIGGACVMEGEDGDDGSVSDRAFSKVSRWRRFIILIAGVTMNFLMGFVILLFILPGAQDGRIVVPTLDGFYEGFQHEGEDGRRHHFGDRRLPHPSAQRRGYGHYAGCSRRQIRHHGTP